MKNQAHYIVFLISFVSMQSILFARTYISPAPSIRSIGYAEALTSSARNTDALFYNPAGLAYNRFQLRIVGAELSFDKKNATRVKNRFDELNKLDEQVTLSNLFDNTDPDNPIYIRPTARLLDFGLPYFSYSEFATMHLLSEKNDNIHNIDLATSLGSIYGFALQFGMISIGMSRYDLQKFELSSKPSSDQLSTIQSAIKNNTFDVKTSTLNEYTKFNYGITSGYNVGIMLRPFSDNPSSIGASIINKGKSTFTNNTPTKNKDFKNTEEKIRSEAEKHDITLDLPQDLQEIKNLGLTLGWYASEGNWTQGLLSYDYHDYDNKVLNNHRSLAFELGLKFPNKVAVKNALPILSRKGKGFYLHTGISNLKVFGGQKENLYRSYGVSTQIHFGLSNSVSFLTIDLQGYKLTPLDDSSIKEENGFSALAELTVMF